MQLRNPETFNNEITDAFATMKISTRQKLVGSSAVVGNIITNDYDLNELFKQNGNQRNILKKIWKMFCKKFDDIHESHDMWIVDFKCGEKYNDAIRWKMDDLKKGITGGIQFVDCILQKNTKCKLDVVKYLNGRFIEISELYFFDINGDTNFTEADTQLENIIHSLEKDRNELLAEGNKFKAMKREYRILMLMNKNLKRRNKLDTIFNGALGWLYYCISNLKTLAIMKEQSFRPVILETFRIVQQSIKDDIGKIVPDYNWKILDNPRCSVFSIEDLIYTLEDILNIRLKRK